VFGGGDSADAAAAATAAPKDGAFGKMTNAALESGGRASFVVDTRTPIAFTRFVCCCCFTHQM
jgi:hypothetical protein